MKRKTTRRASSKRRNPPARRRRPAAASTSGHRRRTRRRNPSTASAAPRRRRRNPPRAIKGLASKGFGILRAGVAATGGFYAARELPQVILGARNTGVLGYAANIVAGIIATTVARMIGTPGDAAAVTVGAGIAVVQRMVAERMVPMVAAGAAPIAGIGDPSTIAATRNGNRVYGAMITEAAVRSSGLRTARPGSLRPGAPLRSLAA